MTKIREIFKIIEEVDKFLLNVDVQTAEEDREVGRLQELIRNIDEDDCEENKDE